MLDHAADTGIREHHAACGEGRAQAEATAISERLHFFANRTQLALQPSGADWRAHIYSKAPALMSRRQ
ncbi:MULTISPECIES: hypothetical protein [Xanthomonas]|jgi:hypothetical protein|uniref:Uncharacterized protein n=1 Tax=Xanthomonas campestris pv. campestris (strain B100) TaxID=509169 RepID=B0RSC6_XANCB|nr:hypothetical protein [Xanthomonas campestris]MBF9171468.1 hypothetical protein [Xanthomonas campestris pv. campestris]MCC5042109.1 hypothetical protein [Xanthomonas campestris]MDM7677873.1 hypothetical protein [Xanthomonas campestris pv. campestris]MDM7700061.1 hypothetical protein [Xanthomonas campestris pv. campestris]MDM7721548.1 hypothetical protein [Xanthomonas campestris pv. campestris]